MLEALRKHDQKEAERILSSLTSELLPNPGIYIRARLEVDPDLHTKIWSEIRRKAKVAPSDTSAGGRARLFDFLFREMSQRTLSQSTLESTKARLSLKGELRSDLYEVNFSTNFRSSEEHGVRPNHVLEAVRNANDVEHLNLFDNQQLLSLFLRTHNDFPNHDPFALLVLARRVGAGLEVKCALRVYLSDIDYSAALRPLDVLRLLVGKYGFSLTVGHVTAKLIFNETVTIDARLEEKTFVKIHALKGASMFGIVMGQKLRLHNSHGIALGFALDQVRYSGDLRKHGVHVKAGDYRGRILKVFDEADVLRGEF